MTAIHPFLPYARQSIDETDVHAVSHSFSGEFITRGEQVELFERAVADYCGATYAVAFNSGTSALMAACAVVNVGPADRLLSTPNTFVATVGAGMARQATPVFMDIDLKTGNMNLEQLAFNLERTSTRGRSIIMPVHFAGIPVDMERLDRMIKDPDAVVIEDAAHAFGSSYANGQKVGSCPWSQMTVFSFHPAKTLTTGEGGMVTTNDEELYRRLSLFRNNGIEKDPHFFQRSLFQPSSFSPITSTGYYEVMQLSGNFNFTEMQAALGLSQLKRVDQFITKRRKLIKTYRKLLKEFSHLQMLSAELDEVTAYHLCVVQIDFAAYKTSRLEVMKRLHEKGIGTQCHYIPVYHFPFFKEKRGDISEYFPNMEKYYSQTLSLPLYYDLTEADVARVVSALRNALLY